MGPPLVSLHHLALEHMKLVHVVPHVGAEASGPSYSVCSLARALARRGHAVVLFSVLDGQLHPRPNFEHRVYPKGRLLPGLWRSPELLRGLRDIAPASDIVHSHSLWMMPNVYPGWVLRARLPLVISPRGTLSAWALERSRWRKKVAWTLLQGPVVKAATCLHATAEQEYMDIRAHGLRQPVCIVPNGIDVPEVYAATGAARPRQGERTILYMGRLHSVKGIDRLLRAWAAIAHQRPEWQLRIVGPDDGGYEEELRHLAAQLRAPRVTFAGPAYGRQKWEEYRAAALYVLPSHSESFGMTVAEALASGTPVITTKGAPWSGLVQEACGFWIEHGVEPLGDALLHATGLDAGQLEAFGARGREWMQRDFRWDNVAGQMATVYRWLRFGGAAPDNVRLD